MTSPTSDHVQIPSASLLFWADKMDAEADKIDSTPAHDYTAPSTARHFRQMAATVRDAAQQDILDNYQSPYVHATRLTESHPAWSLILAGAIVVASLGACVGLILSAMGR